MPRDGTKNLIPLNKSTSIVTPSGVRQRFTTKITGKGQIALAQKIVDAFRPPLMA